jgi:stage II sporulation protein AA (anti-sigma F factor antagonist)
MSFDSPPHPMNPPAADDPGSLSCEVVPERDAVRVRPIGSLDMATGRVLEQQLNELREAGFRRMIVDLGSLSFMDSTGLKIALKWHEAAQQDGFEIGFAPGPPSVQRVFELTGMSEHLPFIRS